MSGKFELFIGCFGNGLTVCNKAVMEHGDYKQIAHIFENGNIKLYVKDNYIPDEAMQIIESKAREMRKNFLDTFNRWNIYKRYEFLLDKMPWNDFIRYSNAEIVLDERVNKMLEIYLNMYI